MTSSDQNQAFCHLVHIYLMLNILKLGYSQESKAEKKHCKEEERNNIE